MHRIKPLIISVVLLAVALPVFAQDEGDQPTLPLPVAQLEAPVNLVPAESIATYQTGAFLEGVAIDDDGNLYITSTIISSDDGFAEGGETAILKVTPDGTLTEFAQPLGGLAGVIVYAGDAFYMTASTPQTPEFHGVQRMSLDGEFEMFTQLPVEAGPNGITLLPGGNLIVADSNLGVLYEIDRETGDYMTWIDAPNTLGPDQGFYPGANGVQVYENQVYVAVPDRLSIVRIPILEDGSAGEPEIHAEGIAGDDFSIDTEGNLYVTTHPFNTVTKVFPDGSMETIATAEQNIVGSTATVFGNQPGDETSLYVVNDGGLFEVMMGMREAPLEPHIVRLDVGIGGYDVTFLPAQTITFVQPGMMPEGVEYDSQNNRFFVSSLAQGTIFEVSTDGTIQPFIEDELLTSTGGIHIDHENRRLLVTNIDSQALAEIFSGSMPESTGAALGAYDLDTGERLFFTELTQFDEIAVNAVNDVTTDTMGNAYVTNSFAPVIYRISPDGQASVFIQDERLGHPFFGLNGIDYHPNGYLLAAVSGNGSLFRIPLDNPDTLIEVELETRFGADGMILDDDGNLYAVAVVLPQTATQIGPDTTDLRLIQVITEDDWTTATITQSIPLILGFTTVTLVEQSPYVINARLGMGQDENLPQNYQILGFDF